MNVNRFGLDLYKKLTGSPDNLLVSPFSIYSVLLLLYGGARGNTARQMTQARARPGAKKGEKGERKKEMPQRIPPLTKGRVWEGLKITSPVPPSLKRRGVFMAMLRQAQHDKWSPAIWVQRHAGI